MTDRSRTLARIVQLGAGLDEVVGAAFRGVVLFGEASALSRMAEASEEIALKVFGAKFYYQQFIQTQSELARTTALELTRSLAADARLALKDEDLTAVARTLTGWGRVLEEGGDAALRIETAERLAAIAQRRGAAALERLAARSSGERLITIASGLDLQIGRALTNPVSSAETHALEWFLRAVPRSDEAAWNSIVLKIDSFSEIGGKAEQLRSGNKFLNQVEFEKLLRPEASQLKGHALETWFWRSPAWRSREKELMDAAFRRARKLGLAQGQWRPLQISEPLLTIGGMGRRGGLEIYDGVVLVARDYRIGGDVVEGFLDTVVQIKAEQNISAVRQISKDVRREAELGGLTELRTRDGKLAVRLLQAPDNADPFRLIVAPYLPAADRIARLAPGVQVALIPTLLDADQLDDLAFFMLRAAIGP